MDMSRVDLKLQRIPLNGLSLDLVTFSAMSFFASEMDIPLSDAIGLALKEWLIEGSHQEWPNDVKFDLNATQN